MEIDFIKKVLMSEFEYWVVALKTIYCDGVNLEIGDNQIVFISIPKGINRGLSYNEIKLSDIELLKGSYIDQNIYLSDNYAPFQLGMSFSQIYDGYPVDYKIKEFVIKAMALESKDLYDYKRFIEEKSVSDAAK